MTFAVPPSHPRYHSLVARHRIEDGVRLGITTPTGLVAHGRGEAFDYLLGERSHPFAVQACTAAAAALLCAAKPVLSINGNTAMLVAEEMISLGRTAGALLEINIFHDAPERRQKIAERFRSFGSEILGVVPDARLEGLSSDRAKVDSRGMLDADCVVVALEDGDRTEFLVRAGKQVIAVDLNPLSRTPQTAQISIIDNVQRAFPLLEKEIDRLRGQGRAAWEAILASYDNRSILRAAEEAIRNGLQALPEDAL
jgi:4-phosphopantoate--beta-alanine ligase